MKRTHFRVGDTLVNWAKYTTHSRCGLILGMYFYANTKISIVILIIYIFTSLPGLFCNFSYRYLVTP